MKNIELVKWLNGIPIITMNDLESFLGIRIKSIRGGYRYGFFKEEYFKLGKDWNGLGQGEIRERFEMINKVHYEDETFIYLNVSGVIKAINLLINKKVINKTSLKVSFIMNEIEKYKIHNIFVNSNKEYLNI